MSLTVSTKTAGKTTKVTSTSSTISSNATITVSKKKLQEVQTDEVQNGDETIVTTTEKVTIEKSSNRKKSADGETKSGTIKKKSKKSKKSTDSEKENISVGSTEGEKMCKSCGKIVYKMEEVKAEKSVWHKNCFRCSQCSKPLR